MLGYASYFVSFLLSNIEEGIKNIERIVLFGSVAKGEATKESDIDIFIEAKKGTRKFENKIKGAIEKFYQSREAALFKSKGIGNKFNIKIGKIKEWKELYKSIASTGIILYGPYEAKELPSGAKHFAIIFWEGIGKNRGAFLNKIYGFNIRNKHYAGMLEKYSGIKIGKSCIMVPAQYKKDILELVKGHKVKARIIETFK